MTAVDEDRDSPRARRDIAAILRTSERSFGRAARSRYRRLIQATFDLLKVDPGRPGVSKRDDLLPGVRLLHLKAAKFGNLALEQVSRPRHDVVFRFAEDTLQILRVLHDAMDLAEHVDG